MLVAGSARRDTFTRPALILAAACAVSFVTDPAFAQDAATKAACGSSYVEGQRFLREGSLKKARDKLLVCARDPCPAAFQPECVQWLNDVDRRMPSVLFEARTPDGNDVSDASVSMDGAPLSGRIDVRAVEIEPGEHTFRFERPGSAPVEKTIVLREGEKSRRLAVVLEAASGRPPAVPSISTSPGAASQSETPSRPVGWPVWVAGGVGVAALVSFTGFAIAGLVQHETLDACKGSCSPADVSSDRTKLELADVSLGVSVAALATATVLLLTRPTLSRTAAAFRTVDPMVGPRGAGASWSIRF